jgi:HEAT repeat protein
VDPLLPLLKDKKKIVRKTAAWALGTIADERAIAGLTETLTDEDAEVRDAAQKALDSIQNEKFRKSTISPVKV